MTKFLDPVVVPPAVPKQRVAGRRRVLDALLSQRTLLAVLVVGLVIVFAITNPNFLNQRFVLFPMLRDASVVFVIGLAQMFALSIGQMNLAVGRMAAVGALVAGASYDALGVPLVVGVAMGVIAGGLLGALAGWIIVVSGVNAFVVTLSLDFALVGMVTLVYRTFTEAAAFTTKPDGMDFWRNGSFADFCFAGYCGPEAIPVIILPTAVIGFVIWWLFARARAGRELIATGASIRAAELSGIDTRRRVIFAHTVSGLLAGLAGVMLAFTSGSFSAAVGSEFMLPSFLAPILGGTLLTGGVISVVGTALGALFTGVIRMGLSVQGLGIETLNMALGAVLLGALALQRLRRKG